MKTLCIFFLLIVHSFAFGQPPKKLNKQLKAELLVEQQKMDSALQQFRAEQNILIQLRRDTESHLKTSLYAEEKTLRKTHVSIDKSMNTLKNLEISTREVFPNGDNYDSDPKYNSFIKPLYEALNKQVKFEFVTVPYELDEWKLKEQNEFLLELVAKSRTYAKYNQINSQTQRNYIQEITAFRPRIDSLCQVYQLLNSDLQKKSELLTKKINAARENYRLKDPNDFPFSYRIAFPEIHPIPYDVENTVDIGGIDAVPVIHDVPAIVEAKESEVYTVVDEPAEFPGGMSALKSYISKHLKIPQIVEDLGFEFNLQMKFVVLEDGSISNVMVVKGAKDCMECKLEAIRVLEEMPKWKPAQNKGQTVKSYYNLPIEIHLR